MLLLWIGLAFGIVVGRVGDTPDLPFWGGSPQFSVDVTYNVTGVIYSASYFYDWSIKSQRYQYNQPQQDQMCQQSGHVNNWQSKRCNVIYASDGYIYIEYPEENECCKCTDKFGAVRYDWLQSETSYVGRKVINGIEVDEWVRAGDTRVGYGLNHYYATAANQTIFMFYQQKPNKTKRLTYDISTYRKDRPSSDKFKAPPNCSKKCLGLICLL